MSESKTYIPALKYDWLTKVYDPVLQFTMPEQKIKSTLILQMNVKGGQRILDFGCGSLTLTIMAAQVHPQSEFFGVDVDYKILGIARKKLIGSAITIDLRHYDGTKLPYPNNYFDKVMSSLVFHHLTLRQKYDALNEIKRVLKPAGEIHIADFGEAANSLQRITFYGIQLLDGFETTTDNIQGKLTSALTEIFSLASETALFKTVVGTVRLIKAIKPNEGIL